MINIQNAVLAVIDRLEAADIVFSHDNDMMPDEYAEAYDSALEQLVGAYCGCNTCIANEAVDAAFPFIVNAFLADIVSDNDKPNDSPCCVVSKRAWTYHVALVDIWNGATNPKDLAAQALGLKKEDK